MNTFNIKRFVKTIRWTEKALLSHTIRTTAGLTIGYVLLTFLCCFAFQDSWDAENVIEGVQEVGALLMVFSGSIVVFYGSMVMKGATRQQDRVFLLMLPASNSEKFWARVLHVTVILSLECLVAIAIADVLQYVLHLLWHQPTASLLLTALPTDATWGVEADQKELAITTALMTQLCIVWIQSVYMLGGMLFRKHQWLWTSLFCFIGGGIVITAITFIMLHLVESGAMDGYVLDLYGSAYISMAVFAVLIVFNYWMAYRIFSRIQLINNRWTNL